MVISREDLYRRVWSTPVSRLAKELDISDVGLAKACRKAGIPLPPMGYWTKVAHGKVVPRPVLPPSDKKTVEIDAQRFRTPQAAVAERAQRALDVQVPPEIPERLPPFTAATKAQLMKTSPQSAGFASSFGPSAFECRVGVNSVQRTLRVLAAFELNLSTIGGTLTPGKQRLEVEVEGQRLEFRVVEQIRRTEVVVEDIRHKGSVSRDYRYEFSGLLNVEVLSYYVGRKKWTDGKRAPLTDKIGDFLQGLVAGARAMRRHQEAIEAQQRKWAEEARRRQEQGARRKALQDMQQRLVEEATASEQSRRVLDYLGRLRAQLAETGGALPAQTLKWLEFSERLARSLDPLPHRLGKLNEGAVSEPYPGLFDEPLPARE